MGRMDHLPSFGASAPIEVPYLGREIYDGLEFQGYPERKGWDVVKIIERRFDGRTYEETASFLQTWLYFGLLSSVIPIDVKLSDFLYEPATGQAVVTTKCLPRYIHNWHEHVKESSSEQRLKEHRTINKIFEHVFRFIMIYCDISAHEQENVTPSFAPLESRWPLSPEIAISIMVLADSLGMATFSIYEMTLSYSSWGISQLSVDRMLDAGWCPNVMSILRSTGQTQPLYYASTLGSPRTRKDHTLCSRYTCSTDQINPETYIVKHRTEGCQCSFLEAPVIHIAEVVRRGHLPLIVCKEINGVLKLEVYEHEKDTNSAPYVAISHVWSDGLGNPTQNALPTCQLQHLQRLVDELQCLDDDVPRTPFWMDTLCVPVAERHKQIRKLAIRNMAHTYRNAAKVLVLDTEILQSSKEAPMLELYTRVKLSGWMRRLWTLQEGTLAYDLFFQLRDGVQSIIDIIRGLRKEMSTDNQILYTRFDQDAVAMFKPIFENHRDVKFSGQANLASLPGARVSLGSTLRSLQWRSTSRRGDETVCIATLLGLDPLPLMDIPEMEHGRRMIQLLQMLPKIPLGTIFQPPPQLHVEGFRWASPSFLASVRNNETLPTLISGHDVMANLGPLGTGLVVKQPGLMMDPREPGVDYTKIDGLVMRLTVDPSRFFDVGFMAHSKKREEEPEEFSLHDQRQPAIVLSKNLLEGTDSSNIFGAMVFLRSADYENKIFDVVYYRTCTLDIIEAESYLQILHAGKHFYKEASPAPADWTWHIN